MGRRFELMVMWFAKCGSRGARCIVGELGWSG